MFNFKTFDSMEWFSYGGAEPFADGSAPLFSSGDVRIDHEPAEIIVDGAGVSLNWWVDDLPYYTHVSGAEGARLLTMLRPEMTYAELAALPGVKIQKC